MKNPIVIKVTTFDRRSLLARGIYRLQYLANTNVKAVEGSLGCMCFDSLEPAKYFIPYTYPWAESNHFLYLRVRGIDAGLYRPHVSRDTTMFGLKEFYINARVSNCIVAPPGTACYLEIRVLN